MRGLIKVFILIFLGIVLISLLPAQTYRASVAQGSNYSVMLFTLGSQAGLPQGSNYMSRSLLTAFQPGSAKANGTVYAANIGFLGNSTFSWVNATTPVTPPTNETTQNVTTPTTIGGNSYVCEEDSDCANGNVCFRHKCVKLFDIKITAIQSPIYPGEFFNFTYFVKGMANINGDVVVEFWLEKEGKNFTSGRDTIYLGSFEEKTDSTQLFLPKKGTLAGIYRFYIQVNYERYSAFSYRVIEVNEEGEVKFTKEEPQEKWKITPPQIIFATVVILLIFINIVLWFIYKFYKKRRAENYGFSC
jgi:hypothetical protein